MGFENFEYTKKQPVAKIVFNAPSNLRRELLLEHRPRKDTNY